MKNIFLLTIALLAQTIPVFCQCPESGMKFQGLQCEKPKNAEVKNVTCSELKVKWKASPPDRQSSETQSFVVEANYLDAATNKIIKLTPSEASCDKLGHCNAIFPVEEGTIVNWSVQAKCKNAIYSDTLQGKTVTIPSCKELTDNSSALHVYPNPSNGHITVEFTSDKPGKIHFTVYDMTGQTVFNEVKAANSNNYKFDLTGLAPGIYLLEARNDEDVNRVKFMIE